MNNFTPINLDEMDRFFEKYNESKLTEEETEHLNSVVFTKKIVHRKTQFDEYTIQLLQTFMEETK